MDNIVESVLDSFAIYRGKESHSRDSSDASSFKNQISPFMEKVSLVPVQDFINIFGVLKELSSQKIVIRDTQISYPNTLSLF